MRVHRTIPLENKSPEDDTVWLVHAEPCFMPKHLEFESLGQAELYTMMLDHVDIEWFSIIERHASSTPAKKRSEMVAAGRKAYTKSFIRG
jgi:hypothetical protein